MTKLTYTRLEDNLIPGRPAFTTYQDVVYSSRLFYLVVWGDNTAGSGASSRF